MKNKQILFLGLQKKYCTTIQRASATFLSKLLKKISKGLYHQ